MAGLFATVSTASKIALTASVEKIILTLTAPTNQRLVLKGWRCSMDGNSATADQSSVKLCKITSTITGTTVTPVKITPGTETLQATSKSNLSAGTVSTDVFETLNNHPQTGYEKVTSLGCEYPIPGGETLGIVVTSANAVNATGQFWYEE